MGQWLIVQGQQPARVAELFQRALSLAPRFLVQPPSESLLDGGTAVLAFGRALGDGASLVRGAPAGLPPSPRALTVSAGAWLLHGAVEPGVSGSAANAERAPQASGEALRRIGAALREGDARFLALAPALDGFFALAAVDPARGETALLTDRNGMLHVYRAQSQGCVLLGTSALLLGALVQAPLDPLAAAEFLGTGSVFEGRSLLQGVEKLPPASLLRFREGQLQSCSPWWDLAAALAAPPPREPVEALAEALRLSVGAVLSLHPQAVLDLTGGFDSRGVVAAGLANAGLAAAGPASGRPLRTVVVGEDHEADVVAANRIAQALHLAHTQVRRAPAAQAAELDRALRLTDGECELHEYAAIAAVHRQMAEAGGQATVNGTVGELCRGYWWDLLPRGGRSPRERLDPRRAALLRFATDPWVDGALRGADGGALPPLAEHFAGVVARTLQALGDLPGTAQADAVYLRLRMQRWAGRLASSTDRLWPCYSPFLFRAPLETALAAPVALRRHDGLARRLIERLHPALAALPMANGAPALPLRPSNALRFLPLLPDLARRVAARLRPAAESSPQPAFTLDAATLRTRGLYQPGRLEAVCHAAQQGGRAAVLRARRVATLEALASSVEQA
ncbi:MAG: asparagine synthase-related protein [Planctomycetota bacterium]